jgi:SAM-dependent methyltransferase
MFSFLAHYRPDWRQERILDAGCGTGKLLERLGSPKRNVGVDLADESLVFCKKRGLENVVKSDVCDLPFAENSFESVICASVLYHQWVPEPEIAVREFSRVLVKGGVFLVELPAYTFLHSAHDEAVYTARRFTIPMARGLLNANGFQILRLSHRLTFAFPLAFMARTLRLVPEGRDFSTSPSRAHKMFNTMMDSVARVENQIMRKVDLPIGTSIYCVAQKT